MEISSLLQLTAVSALLVGPTSIIASLLTEEIEERYPQLQWLFFVNSIFLALAFLGLYLYQSESIGPLGLAGYITALVAVLLMERPSKISGMESWEFGGAIIAIATIFMALATFSTGRFPTHIPTLMLTGIVLGIPAVFIKSYQRIGYILGGIAFGAAMLLAGNFMLAN